MKTATSGCSALCLTIGLLLCFAAPLHAAPAAPDDTFQPSSIAQAGGSPLAAPQDVGAPKAAAGKEMVADDLTEADRAAQEEPQKRPVAVASNDEQGRAASAAAGNDHSVWDETSLIGKIFIGLGTLLTLASAARMFMA
jgi:hypothetical protein